MAGKKMSFSKILADKLKKIAVLSDKIRLKIVLAIFNTEILKIGHSLTFSQLEKLTEMDKHNLAYHLLVLRRAGVIEKKEFPENGKKVTYYQTTADCIGMLNLLGITKDKINELKKGLAMGV